MPEQPRYLTRTVQLREYKDPEMFEALAKAASRDERTLTDTARRYLKRALEEDGYNLGREAA